MGSWSTRNGKTSREENRQSWVSVSVMDWLCRMSFKLEHFLGIIFPPTPWLQGILLLPELQDTEKCPPLVLSCTEFTLTRSADTAKGPGCNTIGCLVEKHYIYYCSWENLERLGGLHSTLIPKGNLGINQGELEPNFGQNYSILLSVANLNSNEQTSGVK